MKITKIEEQNIADWQNVTVTRMNHLIEVQHMEKMNRECHIRKIDKERYVHLETGEVGFYDLNENRSQNTNSLRQTFKKLRYLINNNFNGSPNELFVTLTYRGELQTRDHIKVGKDYDNFLKRLKRRFKDVTTIDAIKVLEPHQSGNWHMHVLLRFNDLDKVYIPNDEFKDKIWKNGYVTIKSLKDVDNIGAYVSAYLSDIDVPEDYNHPDVIEKEVNGEKKKFIKGARLAYYPSGVNLYSKTKGIEYPERKEMAYEDIKKIVGAVTPHYKKSIKIADIEKDYSNTITYEQYNLKRL